jgi:outer membrane protein assembly factor BamB
MRAVSSPQLVGDLIIGTTGSGGGGNYVVAIKPGEKPAEVYRIKTQAPYVPTPVIKGDLMFLWSEQGIVTCVDVKTGEKHWQQRIGGKFWASPVIAGDKLYSLSESGEVVVLAAEKEFKELGRMPLGDESRSTPAISGGRIYLRTMSKLFSLGGKSA